MHTQRTARLLLAAPAMLGVLVLAGCNNGDSETDAPVATDTPAAVLPTDEPTVEPTVEPVVESTPVPETPREFPEDVDYPEQGGTYTAVVLSAGSRADVEASQASVAKYGYTAYSGHAGCSRGLPEALDLAGDQLVSEMLFADLETAKQFVDAYTAAEGVDVVGVAEIQKFCVDG